MQSWMIVSAVGVFASGWMSSLLPLTVLVPGTLLTLGYALWRRGPVAIGLSSLLVGLSYGSYWGQGLLAARLPAALEAQPLKINARVLEPPQVRSFSHSSRRQRFAASVELLECGVITGECPLLRGKVLLSYYGQQTVRAGERWQFEVKLKRPRGLANPGSFNYEAWLAQNGFVATGTVRKGQATRLGRDLPLNGLVQHWRQLIADAHPRGGPVTGVLLALSNGDRSAIVPGQWRQFQRYGLNHLVVISGLHVGLVAAVGFLLGRLAGRRPAHLCAALAALAYSALAGFALPTLRALVMLASVQVVAIAGRKIRPLRSLSLALLAIAVIDPLATHGAGFWLSFCAVSLIFYLRTMHPDLSGFRLTCLLQLVLSVGMGVLASFWFGGFGWLAPLANLVAVPVLGFWLAPLCLLAACLLPLSEATAMQLWQLAALPVQGFHWLDAQLQTGSLTLWLHYRPSLSALLWLSLGLLLMLASPQLGVRRWALACLFCAALSRPQAVSEDELEIWVLDVGQGLAVVALSNDRVVIYDTGAGDPAGANMATAVLIPFLERRGVEEIDLLVISHGDRDHASGVYSLHRRFPVAATWTGAELFPGLQGQRNCQAGDRVSLGALQVDVLYPRAGPLAPASNNRSCVIRLMFRGSRMLLPGDVDAAVERQLVRQDPGELAAELLVVSHHGSRSSSSAPFLTAVGASHAIISRGYLNRFSHPHPEVLAKIRRRGMAICDTAEQGALGFRLRGGEIEELTAWRRERHYYWSAPASPTCRPAYNGAQEIWYRRYFGAGNGNSGWLAYAAHTAVFNRRPRNLRRAAADP